jgi:diketogulonate reductase-like aldo/keto reductase
MNQCSAMRCRRCLRRGDSADVFVTTKLWNNNPRPERGKPDFEASRQRLRLDYVDCYLVHTPFAFQPGGAAVGPLIPGLDGKTRASLP